MSLFVHNFEIIHLNLYFISLLKTQGDALIIQNVARILENVIPLVDHPNPKFLADLEEDLMKLIIKQGQNVSSGA